MDLDKIYHDSEGNECNILQMVKKEPEWAANRIQVREASINKDELADDLTSGFIEYQQNLDNPMPVHHQSFFRTTGKERFRSDQYFHAKVMNLVAGVMGIVERHIRNAEAGGVDPRPF